MGARKGGMTAATEWVISLSDLQRMIKDFSIPVSKHRVQDVYKRVVKQSTGFFNNGINFDTFRRDFFCELGQELVKQREERATQEQKALGARLKKLRRKLKEKDYTLHDDDVKVLKQDEFEAEIELLAEELEGVERRLESLKE